MSENFKLDTIMLPKYTKFWHASGKMAPREFSFQQWHIWAIQILHLLLAIYFIKHLMWKHKLCNL